MAIAALIVVVYVAASDARSAQTSAAVHALEETLAPEDVVLLQVASSEPAPRADALATITWSETGRAHLEVRRVDNGETTERDVEFKPSDANVDRGRTIGFALASMLPREGPPAPPVPPPPPAPPADIVRAPNKPPAWAWSIDATFAAMTGLGGTAGGAGGALGVRRDLVRSLDVRAGAALTYGKVAAVGGSLLVLRPRVGAGLRLIEHGAFAVGVRVETGPFWHSVARAGTAPERGGRWLFGTEALAEASLELVPHVAALLDLGADFVFGTTRVLVDGRQQTTLPPIRAVAELGGRVRF